MSSGRALTTWTFTTSPSRELLLISDARDDSVGTLCLRCFARAYHEEILDIIVRIRLHSRVDLLSSRVRTSQHCVSLSRGRGRRWFIYDTYSPTELRGAVSTVYPVDS